ncbi:uncharacterized protein LOC129602583 isoform X2 [Paramacrobiotus metropolitanus]|uniref:uncharacterized protein LOC129602583 isoform X2 n=1 Tax=Paramacrobiotus metropolitanus TaxID=2943436 RepID=UPI002445A7D7|nr:uncharacterized protein LOC129602583 isoform X2 [Paramacrobiotus metropolitanus]
MSSRASSGTSEYTAPKVLAWARGLETFERMDFVYLLMHSLFPTELRYIHGILDGLLKRDEALYAGSVNQANDFVRLSHFYENYDPRTVMANDGLRRQFIVDLSALHPLNFYCADIFFGVLQRAELGTWSFNSDSQKLLRELILITLMVARHAAFRFDNRLFVWNISRTLTQKLKIFREAEEQAEVSREETEEELEELKSHADIPALTPEPVEQQSTVTASGADRLPNGLYESPPPFGRAPYNHEKREKKPPTIKADFPPLGGNVNHRPKAPTISARVLEVAPSMNAYEAAPYGDSRSRAVEQALVINTHESSFAENCDFQDSRLASNKESFAANKETKGSNKTVSALPVSSSTEFPHFAHQNMPLVAPSLSNSVAQNFPKTLDDDVESLRRNAAEAEDVVHMVAAQEKFSITNNRPSGSAPGIIGAFPRVYSITGPSGPRLPSHVPYSLPPHHNFAVPPVFPKPVSCYNCGFSGHLGEYCPKKKPLDSEQADKYCSLQRDAKRYPEKSRPSTRLPGPHSHHP